MLFRSDRQLIAVPDEMLRHDGLDAGRRPVAIQHARLQVRRRDRQNVADPFAGRIPLPRVFGPGWRLRPSVEPHRSLLAGELTAHRVGDELLGDRIEDLLDPGDADHEVLRRVRLRLPLFLGPDGGVPRVDSDASGGMLAPVDALIDWRRSSGVDPGTPGLSVNVDVPAAWLLADDSSYPVEESLSEPECVTCGGHEMISSF